MTRIEIFRRLFNAQSQTPSSRIRVSRSLMFEPLEERLALNAAPILQGLPEYINLTPGTSYHVALDGKDDDGDNLTFTVQNSNSTLLNASVLEGNESVKFTVYEKNSSGSWAKLGDITFELFDKDVPLTTKRIKEIIAGTEGANGQVVSYNGVPIHRVIDGFMLQGGDVLYGDGRGGTGTKFDDDYVDVLQHSGRGIVSTANSNNKQTGVKNTNDSQFFITDNATLSLDGNHTIFGFVTEGDELREYLNAVETHTVKETWGTRTDVPVNDLKMDDFTVFTDQENGTLRIVVPKDAAPGTTTLTVMVSDGVNEPVPYEIKVNVIAEPTAAPTWSPPTTIDLKAGQTYKFTLPDYAVPGQVDYTALKVTGYSSDDLKVSINGREVTIEAPATGGGLQWIVVTANPRDNDSATYTGYSPKEQFIPLFITPSAPTIKLAESADTGTVGDNVTSKDNTSGNELVFEVSNVLDGATITLYRDEYEMPFEIVSSVSQSNGLKTLTVKAKIESAQQKLSDDTYTFSASQTFVPDSMFGHDSMISDHAADLAVVIDTKAPVFTSPSGSSIFDATVGSELAINFRTDDHLNGKVKYTIDSVRKGNPGSSVEIPEGMSLDAASGRLSWTPVSGQADDYTIIVRATDGSGNTATQSVQVLFQNGPEFTISGPLTVDEGEEIVLELAVTDPDFSGEVTFELLEGSFPSGKDYRIEKTGERTARFIWTTTEADGPGVYEPVFVLRDSENNSRRKNVILTVNEIDTPPVFTNEFESVYTLKEHVPFSLQLTASDADIYPGADNPLVFSVVGSAPQGMVLDSTTGHLSWTPGEDCGDANFEVTVRVSDKTGLFAEVTLQLFVEETDDPPVFGDGNSSFSTNTGQTFSTTITARDPDYAQNPAVPINSVVYSLLGDDLPEGLTIDPTTGMLSWVIPYDYLGELKSDSVSFTIQAQEKTVDGSLGLSSSKTVTLEIVNQKVLDQIAVEEAEIRARAAALARQNAYQWSFATETASSLLAYYTDYGWSLTAYNQGIDPGSPIVAGLGDTLSPNEIDINGSSGQTEEQRSETNTSGEAETEEEAQERKKREKGRQQKQLPPLQKNTKDDARSAEQLYGQLDLTLSEEELAEIVELAEQTDIPRDWEYSEMDEAIALLALGAGSQTPTLGF